MKKTYITCLLMATTCCVSAQTDSISNGGFEIWQSHGTYSDPDPWYTLNFLTDFGFDTTTFRTTDAHSGMYAVKLVSQGNSFQDIPGIIASGQAVDGQGNVDFNALKYGFTSRPEKISFWYKSLPVGSDTCSMFMALLRWNQAFQQSDTIAMAAFNATQVVSSWTLVEIPFTYRLPLLPDSAAILFASSRNGFTPNPGSTFYIDDVKLVYDHTGINETHQAPEAMLYPNPANKELFIDLDKEYELSVYDQLGKQVFRSFVSESHYRLSTETFGQGMYDVQISGNDAATRHYKIIIR